MKSIKEIRRERLRWLINLKWAGSVPAFHKAMKFQTPGYGARLVSESKGNQKPIGDKAARDIERVAKVEPFTLDTPLEVVAQKPKSLIALADKDEDPMAQQLLALFNQLSTDGRDLLLLRANRLFIEENPDASAANPYGMAPSFHESIPGDMPKKAKRTQGRPS